MSKYDDKKKKKRKRGRRGGRSSTHTQAAVVDPDDDKIHELLEGIRPAFGSPGGKRQLAQLIASLIPEHKKYVEPFIGGGAVFFAKDPSETEIINDLDPEIALAYRFIQGMSESSLEQLQRRDTSFSRSQFARLKSSEPKSEQEKFYRFIYTNAHSFGRNRKNAAETATNGHDLRGRFGRYFTSVKPRLEGVTVTSTDFRELIKEHDAPDTLFYLDPPYPEQQGELKTDLTNEAIAEAVHGIKGKFILSLPDTESVRENFKGYTIMPVKVRRTLNIKFDHKDGEVLIANFKLVKPQQRLAASAPPISTEGIEFVRESLLEIGGSWRLERGEYRRQPGSDMVIIELRMRRDTDQQRMTEATVGSGLHPHPHGPDGAHQHLGLPAGGGHSHEDLATGGGHRHRPGDPVGGWHLGDPEDEGAHVHILALKEEVPELFAWYQQCVAAHWPIHKWLEGHKETLIQHIGVEPELRPTQIEDWETHCLWSMHSAGANLQQHAAVFLDADTRFLRRVHVFEDGTRREVTLEDFEKEVSWFDENLPFPLEAMEARFDDAITVSTDKGEEMQESEWAANAAQYITKHFCGGWAKLTESQRTERWVIGLKDIAAKHPVSEQVVESIRTSFREMGFKHGARAIQLLEASHFTADFES